MPDSEREDLLRRARERGIAWPSKMGNAELAAAIAATDAAGEGSEGKERITDRRRRLATRLAEHVDPETRCPWRSIEGFGCGLPAVAGRERCLLHGGGDITDLAVPVTGRLGFDTWPVLWRHMWLASYDVDDFGLDPLVAEMAWHVLNVLYFDYFRVEVEGISHVPASGPALLAANHGGGALPYDAAMLQLAVANEAAVPRRVRVLATEIFNMLPGVSHLYRKAGGAYATPDDAHRLLSSGHLVGVFPEGERGFMKPVWQAYRLQRFGRGGFVASAGTVAAPIVPVAILGSEEVHPAVAVSARLADLVKLVFPQQRVDRIAMFLNPIPLPVRWTIRFLPPIDVGGGPDPLEMLETAESVRDVIQKNLEEMLAARTRLY